MFRAAVLSVMLVLPVLADQGAVLSPGHVTEARILGLDPHIFSRVDLAQISAEETLRDRRDRVRFILQMKERRGELPKGFSRSAEGQRIIRAVGW